MPLCVPVPVVLGLTPRDRLDVGLAVVLPELEGVPVVLDELEEVPVCDGVCELLGVPVRLPVILAETDAVCVPVTLGLRGVGVPVPELDGVTDGVPLPLAVLLPVPLALAVLLGLGVPVPVLVLLRDGLRVGVPLLLLLCVPVPVALLVDEGVTDGRAQVPGA